MSPREKHLAILSALGLVTLAFYYIPVFLYLTLFVIVCCILWYYHNGQLLPARLGLYPRVELNVPFGIRRWLGGWGVTGVSVAQRKRSKSSKNKTEVREPESNFRVTGVYRRESETESFIFSPRDFLMGSYIGKPESPPVASGRPRVTRNPREQLREKLSRPNHAVYTPNRRLSFAGYVLIQSISNVSNTSPRPAIASCVRQRSVSWRSLIRKCAFYRCITYCYMFDLHNTLIEESLSKVVFGF